MVSSVEQDLIVPVAIFAGKDDNHPVEHKLPWPMLAARLGQYEERSSKDGRAWSPVTYRPGSTRAKTNVQQVHALVLDIDHQELPLDLLEGLEYVAHTTYSHSQTDPRWRVVLPLAESIPGAAWPEFWLRANAHFGGCIDPATKDASRIFYLPSCQPNMPHETRQQHGRFLDQATLPPVPQYVEPKKLPRQTQNTSSLAAWASRFFEAKLGDLASMSRGERNAQCNRLAYLVGGLIADGRHGLVENDIAQELLGACIQNGLVADDGQRSVEATIASGLTSGQQKPWSPAEQESRVAPHRLNGARVSASPPPAFSNFRIWRAPELASMTFDSTRWAIPDLLPAGLAILAGRPKLGKSWMGLGWAIDIARGAPALGKLSVIQGEALYLALEDGPRRMQERIALMLGETPQPENLWITPEWERTNEGGIDHLDKWLSDHPQTRLVVIDTFKRVRPIEKNSQRLYDLDYDAIAPLAAMARERNVAIVVVFHTRKGESSDPLEMVSGTLGLSGAADCVMVLRRERGQADASLFVTGRDVEEQDLALRFDHDDELGWTLLGNAEQFRRTKERQGLLDAIDTMPGMTPSELADAMGKSRSGIRRLLFNMVRDGDIRTRDGHYFSSFLANTASSANSGNTQITQNRRILGNAVTAPVLPPVRPVRPVRPVDDVRGIAAVRGLCKRCGRDWETHGARDPISCQWADPSD